jgi:hypothetical protein
LSRQVFKENKTKYIIMTEESDLSVVTSPTKEFTKIIKEFIQDIKNTFPEYHGIINQWWDLNNETESISFIFQYCLKLYPEKLLEILYQNEELFSMDSNHNTDFLPGISFKYLWNSKLTDKTRETIWKYLQLIVISLIDTIRDKTLFGDTSKLLENVNNEEFKMKLEETLENIQDMFSKKEAQEEENNQSDDFQLPSPDDLQSHISGMLGGKLGDLAKEIAEEAASKINIDIDEETTEPKEIFSKLFSDPTTLMDLVKKVGSKLDNKIKSGELNQSELFSEASEMMNKMKSIPGMDNIQDMISKLGLGGAGGLGGLGGGGKNTRVDKNAMNQQFKKMSMREKMKKKIEERNLNKMLNEAAAEMCATNQNKPSDALSDEELCKLFKSGKNNNKGKNKNASSS